MSVKFCQQLLRLLERNETLIIANGDSLSQCPELMNRIMEQMGVDPNEAARIDGGLAWQEARTKCLFCRRVGTCWKWVEGLEAQTTPAEFCPNVRFFCCCVERGEKGHGAYSQMIRERT